MSRYLGITVAIEVQVEDDVTDADTEATANLVTAVVKQAFPDATDVSLLDYLLSASDSV